MPGLGAGTGGQWRRFHGQLLRDTIQPFPTFSEIYVATLKTLRNEIAGAGQPAGTTSP